MVKPIGWEGGGGGESMETKQMGWGLQGAGGGGVGWGGGETVLPEAEQPWLPSRDRLMSALAKGDNHPRINHLINHRLITGRL